MRRPDLGIIALAILAGACAVPTEAPNWDVTWDLPVPDSGKMNIGVKSFLVSGVTIDSSVTPRVFSAAVQSAPPIARTLGAQCPACPNATAQKPAFTAPLSSTTVTLTSGASLTSGTLTTGSKIALALNNGFTFDPIRPPGGATGTMTFTVSNGAATLGLLTLDGATSAIPAGATSNFTIPLAGTISSGAAITVTMTMVSPAGSAASPVAMNSAQPFTATATPTLNISQATVALGAQPLAPTNQTLDLGALSNIQTHVVDSATTQGTMYLIVTNPVGLGAATTLTFSGTSKNPNGGSGLPFSFGKLVTIPSSATPTTVAMNFTGTELRQMLGSKVTATFTGNTAAGSATVTPTSTISMKSRIAIRFFMQEAK
jgi:hypothetical protein